MSLKDASLETYLDEVTASAKCEKLEDNFFFAEAEGFAGVWGDGATSAAALRDFRYSLRSWVLFHTSRGLDIPPVPARSSHGLDKAS